MKLDDAVSKVALNLTQNLKNSSMHLCSCRLLMKHTIVQKEIQDNVLAEEGKFENAFSGLINGLLILEKPGHGI